MGLLSWIHCCLARVATVATDSKQITYNPVLLAVTEMGGKSRVSSQGRDVNPAQNLRKAP